MERYALLNIKAVFSGGSYESNKRLEALLDEATILAKQNEGIESLATGTWLIELETALPLLSQIAHKASSDNVPYRVLFLDQKPEWLAFGDWDS